MEALNIFPKVSLLAMMVIAPSCMSSLESEQATPNIILIMSDDQGWGDTGYNGHPLLKTPFIDSMAANGVIFNRFYAASAVCSPTRGSVLTGRHPLRYGICHANCGHIEKEEITLAEMVKELGYSTGHFGKWHLGTLTKDTIDANRGGRPEHLLHYAPPWEHGFDVCFSTESKVPTWDPMKVPPKSAGDVKPELMEGSHFGTHYWTGPQQMATDNLLGDDSRIIMDRVIPFIDQAVKKQRPFFSVIWFHTPHLPVLTGEKYQNLYEGLSEDQQHYYGTITAMDQQIGRLRKHLRNLHIEENTVIFFTSDNGPEGTDNKGRTQGETSGLSGRKRSLHEGGIRVPGIVEWPGNIRPGQLNEPCHTSDYFPTISAMLNYDIEHYSRPFDGVNLTPLLKDATALPQRAMFFNFQQQAAVIKDNYKIYSNDGGNTFELYNLTTDSAEEKDISTDQPDIQAEMIAAWHSWTKSVESSANGLDY